MTVADTKKAVAVVIANFNGKDTLQATLESVLAQDYPHIREIILVDNRSTDGSVDFVKERFPSVRILETIANRGPSIARNLGLNETQSGLVLLMDNDIVLSKDYVGKVADVFDAFPSAGAAGGQIRIHEEPDKVQYRGVDIHYAGAAVQSEAGNSEIVRVGALSAGAMLVDREKALAVGAFDEDFIFGWEDGDFSFRLVIAGFPCYVTLQAVAHHLKKQRGLKWVRYQVRNRWWFILKNYDTRTILLALPAILFYQCCIAGLCLIRGRFLDFLAGSVDVVRSLPDILKKRKAVMQMKTVRDSEILCGRYIDMLGDSGNSLPVRIGSRVANSVLSAYWKIIKPLIA